MKKFLVAHATKVLGVLSGFDRVRFRGTHRQWAHVSRILSVLSFLGVLLKGFGEFAEETTARFGAGVESVAQRAGRPVKYLASPQTDKEALVQRLLCENGGPCKILCQWPICTLIDVFVGEPAFVEDGEVVAGRSSDRRA